MSFEPELYTSVLTSAQISLLVLFLFPHNEPPFTFSHGDTELMKMDFVDPSDKYSVFRELSAVSDVPTGEETDCVGVHVCAPDPVS